VLAMFHELAHRAPYVPAEKPKPKNDSIQLTGKCTDQVISKFLCTTCITFNVEQLDSQLNFSDAFISQSDLLWLNCLCRDYGRVE
jgi:hypothetical protein